MGCASSTDASKRQSFRIYGRQSKFEGNPVDDLKIEGKKIVVKKQFDGPFEQGFVIKMASNGNKIFLNVFVETTCSIPKENSYKMIKGIEIKDKSGNECVAYGIVISNALFSEMEGDEEIKKNISLSLVKKVCSTYNFTIDEDSVKFPKIKEGFVGESLDNFQIDSTICSPENDDPLPTTPTTIPTTTTTTTTTLPTPPPTTTSSDDIPVKLPSKELATAETEEATLPTPPVPVKVIKPRGGSLPPARPRTPSIVPPQTESKKNNSTSTF